MNKLISNLAILAVTLLSGLAVDSSGRRLPAGKLLPATLRQGLGEQGFAAPDEFNSRRQ
jgi:hypothetical protein